MRKITIFLAFVLVFTAVAPVFTEAAVVLDNYVNYISPETTVEEFIAVNQGILSVMKDGVKLAGNKFIGTGCDIVTERGTYKAVVTGDVNGDGKAGALDYLIIKKYIMGSAELNGEFALAADINRDGKIGPIDYLLEKKSVFKSYIIPADGNILDLRDENVPADPDNAPSVPVLLYHHIVEDKYKNDPGTVWYTNNITISTSEFRRHMQIIKDEGYTVVTSSQLVAYVKGEIKLPAKSVCLMFDDGYKSNTQLAGPILKEFGYKATIFHIMIGLTKGFQDYDPNSLQYISYPDYNNMSDVFDLQCHTFNNHNYLSQQSAAYVENDLRMSQSTHESKYFAYPYGDYNQTVIDTVKKVGFEAAFTIVRRNAVVGDDPYQIPRYEVNSPMSDETYKKFLNYDKGADKLTNVAYIPLDDRPVNIDRLVYQAESAGIRLIVPTEKDVYSTKLDGTGYNFNGTQYGDTKELYAWLKRVENECEYFIISFDQLLSGGLASSRFLSNTDLSLEYEIIDYVGKLAKKKTVVAHDIIMRLASTVGFMNYTTDDYYALRAYGIKPRVQLTGAGLNISDIIDGYRNDANGNNIYVSVSGDKLDEYLNARIRKLKIADRIMDYSADFLDLYIGVDDSNPTVTIQTNEINYIIEKMKTAGTYEKTNYLFAGADELGMMGLARIITFINGDVKAALSYFGGGENQPADEFDIGTLKSTVDTHLNSVNVKVDPSAELSILVLTKPVGTGLQAASNSLVDKIFFNIDNKIPTIVIDCSGSRVLQETIVSRKVPLGTLLGYSNWNTVANSLGIALGQGVSRYSYLTSDKPTELSHEGFLKSITFGCIKDISYKRAAPPVSAWMSSSDLRAAVMNEKDALNGTNVLALINGNDFIISLDQYAVRTSNLIKVTNFRFPWARTFEMTFDISVS